MRVLEVLAGFGQTVLMVVVVWLIVRSVGRRRGVAAPEDQAASVRRLFVYGLMVVTLMFTAAGASEVLGELLADGAERDNSALALGASFLLVGGAAYSGLLVYTTRRLRRDPEERTSWAWIIYMGLALGVSLVVTIVSAQQLMEGIFGADEFDRTTIAPALVWGGVWAFHWFGLERAHGLPGEYHLTFGSLAGLVTLAVGVGRIAHGIGEEIYHALVDTDVVGSYDVSMTSAAITAGIGALVWGWYWLLRYQHHERTDLWHVFVVLGGALPGLVATVGSATTIAYWTLVWFIGDPVESEAHDHFAFVPVASAIFLVGVLAWQYHRFVLHRGQDLVRTEPIRVYDYLAAAAGLVSAVVGATLAIVAFIEAATPEPSGVVSEVANRSVLAATLLTIGLPLWWVFWSRTMHCASVDPAEELGSPVRRIYLIALFGVGATVVLGGLISVIYLTLEAALDGTLGGETVRSLRAGLAMVLTVTGVAWYHLRVFRADRDALAATAPPPPPPPPPPPEVLRPITGRHVLLIAPKGTNLADELAAVTGASLEAWYRTDEAVTPEIDLASLVARIEASDAEDTLVVIGAEGATVVPYET